MMRPASYPRSHHRSGGAQRPDDYMADKGALTARQVAPDIRLRPGTRIRRATDWQCPYHKLLCQA